MLINALDESSDAGLVVCPHVHMINTIYVKASLESHCYDDLIRRVAIVVLDVSRLLGALG